MRPECVRWDGSRCSLGLWGGVPSPGTCRVCGSYEGPDRGLGDTVARAAKAVGIKPCGGCQKRREALNRVMPLGGRKPFQARLDDVSVAKSAAVQRYDGVREPAEDGGQTDRGEHG